MLIILKKLVRNRAYKGGLRHLTECVVSLLSGLHRADSFLSTSMSSQWMLSRLGRCLV
jgi:hypothetical protein